MMGIELIISFLLVLACFETPFELKCMASLNQSQNQNDSRPPPPPSLMATAHWVTPTDLPSVVHHDLSDDHDEDDDHGIKISVRKRRSIKEVYKNFKASFYLNPGWYRAAFPPTRQPLPPETAENPYPPAVNDPYPDSPNTPPPLPEGHFYGVVLRQNFPPPIPPPIDKTVSTWVSNFAGYVGPVYLDEDEEEEKKNKGKKEKEKKEKTKKNDDEWLEGTSLFPYFTSLLFGPDKKSL